MDKAFDVIFQREVDAAIIAKLSTYSYGERFRYQCLCCGEEVFIAAAESNEKSPHFRHRRGNNDTNCERYLGHPGAIERYVALRKHNREHVGFHFNVRRRTYEVSVSFSAEEVGNYEQDKTRMSFYNKFYSQPFFTVPIDRGTIIPDIRNYFTIDEYSNDYYVSFDGGNNKVLYSDVFKKGDKVNIFKPNSQDEHCRCLMSDLLYTGTDYIAISENPDKIQKFMEVQHLNPMGEMFSFATANSCFHGIRFSIKYADYPVRLFFQQYGLQVDASESFDILWPPVFSRDSSFVCPRGNLYVSSTFELIPHGNIDSLVSVRECGENVKELSVEKKLTVHEKNIDITIEKEDIRPMEVTKAEPKTFYFDKYVVPDDFEYFLFSQNGCIHLAQDSIVYLSQDDKIIGYENGHIKIFIYGCKKEAPEKETVIADVLKYYPKTEKFVPDDFMDVEVDEAILIYLEKCYRQGKINSVLKRFIKEKKL